VGNRASQEIMRGAFAILSIRAIGAVCAFMLNVVLGRVYGAEVVGLYQITLSFVLIASMISRLGMDTSITRFIAGNGATGNWDKARGVYWIAMTNSVVVASLLSGLLFVLAPWISESLMKKPELVDSLRAIAPAVIPLTLTFILASTLRGLGRLSAFAITQGNIGPLIPLFTLAGVAVIGPNLGATGIAIAFFAACTATIVIAMILLSRAAAPFRAVKVRLDGRELYRSCMPLLWASIWDIAAVQGVMMIIGYWLSNAEVGVFSMAWKAAAAASTGFVAVTASIGPKLAAAFSRGEKHVLEATGRHAVKLAMIVSLPVFLLIFAAPGWVMSFFGAEFRDGAVLLVILSVGQMVGVVTGPSGMMLVMCGYERVYGAINSIGSISAIIIAIAVAQPFGDLGVAIAVSIGMGGKHAAMAFAARRLLKVKLV
jgi:O-antigen/teichoic acid export membrane protein